jgi:hypothetical protein
MNTVTTDIDIIAAPPEKRRTSILMYPIAVIIGLALLMGGWYLGTESSTTKQDEVVTGSAVLSSDELAERIEADGVQLVYTEDPELNCAAQPDANGAISKGGCVYMGTSPERIYLSPEMGEDEHVYVLIHEYAHILQARGAWPVGGSTTTGMGTLDSECWADIYASSQGIPYERLHYLGTCTLPGATSLPAAS